MRRSAKVILDFVDVSDIGDKLWRPGLDKDDIILIYLKDGSVMPITRVNWSGGTSIGFKLPINDDIIGYSVVRF